MLDLNDAPQQRATGDLIPDNTIAPVQLTVRPGGSGDGGWLKRSKSGDAMMLDCEFVILEGAHARRKFWTNMTVHGVTEGQQKAMDISRARLRAMLESARGIRPDDESPTAAEKRRVSSYGDFDGLRFWALVGIEKGKDGYSDKNALKAIVTPDRKEWRQLEQPQTAMQMNMAGQTSAQAHTNGNPSGGRPQWAQ